MRAMPGYAKLSSQLATADQVTLGDTYLLENGESFPMVITLTSAYYFNIVSGAFVQLTLTGGA